MDYAASVRTLHSLGRELAAPTQASAAHFSLENITKLKKRLEERAGGAERGYSAVHIAGTNGKGSTAAFLEAILRRAGRRTGLYTSPHLEKINERIRIAGEEISDEAFAETFTRLHQLTEEMLAAGELLAHPTYFECMTAMAFDAFARGGIEWGIFETGLGGRLDATNVVQPAVTVITRIDFDHENYLGHSLREIAGEKAGILKRGVPAVLAPQMAEAREVILARARELGCAVSETEKIFRVEEETFEKGRVRARVVETATGKAYKIAPRLAGRFQLQNALNAVAAARLLEAGGAGITQEAIEAGIAAAEWAGRLEQLQAAPDVFLDGAHNPGAARELAEFWEQNYAGRRLWLVYGALRDKAVDEIAGLLFPRAAEVILTEPRTPRALSARLLAEMAGHHAERCAVVAEPEEAVERALAAAGPGDAVFITGSLYLVGQVRKYWKSRAGTAVR
jgi:dihydrofolate synthase/folylpolyglutamate synthase